MPGNRVIQGERLGVTPVLIVNHEPIWDRQVLGVSPTSDQRVYVQGHEADTNAVNTIRRTWIDGALLQGTRLPTPQFFDCIGVTITIRRAAVNTGDTIAMSLVDLLAWLRAATYFFKVGPTEHLQNIRADFIPSGPDIAGYSGSTTNNSAHVGMGTIADQYPLIVPEEMSLPNGANVYTGRKAPIKILPNEQFFGNIHLEASSLTNLFGRSPAVVVTTWGFKKIEK